MSDSLRFRLETARAVRTCLLLLPVLLFLGCGNKGPSKKPTDRKEAETKAAAPAGKDTTKKIIAPDWIEAVRKIEVDREFFGKARSMVRAKADEDSSDWRPLLLLARLCANFGRIEEARSLFEKAAETCETATGDVCAEILFETGLFYGLPKAMGCMGDEDKASTYISKAVQQDGGDPFITLSKVMNTLFKAKDTGMAKTIDLAPSIELLKKVDEEDRYACKTAVGFTRACMYGMSVFGTYHVPAVKKHSDVEKAREHLEEIIGEDAWLVTLRCFLCFVYNNLGQPDRSIRISNECIDACRGGESDFLGMLYNQRGLAHSFCGKKDQAIDDYTTSIELSRKYPLAYLNRGALYEERRDLDRAISDFTAAIERLPDSRRFAFNNRGIALLGKGDLKGAIRDFDEATKIDPVFWKPYIGRGVAFTNLGETEKALSEYDEVIKVDPSCALAYNNRGLIHMRMGELDKALADLDRSIELNPKYSDAYLNRGLICKEKGMLSRAIENYTKAIEVDPRSVHAIGNRALAHEIAGENDKAIADYMKAIEISPRWWRLHYNIVVPLTKKGNFREALEYCMKAMEYAPPKYKPMIESRAEPLRRELNK